MAFLFLLLIFTFCFSCEKHENFPISSEPAFSPIKASAIAETHNLTSILTTNMRKIILFSALILFYFSSQAQDFSNKGKDFWVGYGYHERMGQANGGTQDMVLYFATDQVTHITISIPGNGYTQNITTAAGYNVITSATIPKNGTQDARLNVEGLSNKGIHITSDRPMVAYAHIYNASVSGATILFPTNTLGKEYYSVNYKNWSNTTNSNCWFYVVAVDTGTTYVEITPTGNTTGGWVAGNTYTVSLTQGQIYNVMGAMTINSNCGGNNQSPCTSYDLTGSLVKSVSNGTSCKKIGVFSGSGRISITCTSFGSSSDNYMAQNVPKSAWGKKYLTASASGNSQNNIYRVCVPDPTTIVRINGVITPIAGFYYEIASTSAPQLIEADKPILVAQYFTSQGACGNGTPGDPEVIYLSPVEQSIKDILWNATPFNAITQQYFNVVIPNSGTAISSFRLYNSVGTQLPTNAFIVHPQDPNYSYLKQQLPGSGVYRVVSDSGFNAIAYGFGSAESYGYNAGTNVKDLYQQIGVQTTWGIETTPSVCTNTPFKFKVSLPYCADSIKWNLSNLPGPPAAPPTAVYPTCASADSSTIVNGKPIYWYSLPSLYSFSSIGTYPVTITTYFPTSECGGTQDIDFDLQISDPPLPSFTEVLPGCYAEPVQFIETTPQTPKPTYTWYWDFGDGNTSTGKNPTHTYAAPGTYYVRYASITTPGCLSDTIGHSITITDLPKATVSGTTAVCLNAASPAITFTGTDGAAPYEFSYTINGVAQTPVISNAAGSYTINVPTNIAGPFTYAITSVKNAGSTLCVRPINNQQVTVTVNPLPQAAIAGATTVCLNAPSPPITFTGSGGTAPYTFAYTINGVAQTPVVSNAGGTYTVNAPTNVAGTFAYSITTVTDASSTLCNQPYNNTVTTTVTVKPLPTASVTGSATTVCLNAASPQITFTGSTGTAPYTFSYTLNGVPQTPVVSNAAGTYTINVPTNAVGPQIYVITNVQESSANTCSQAITGQSYTVTVNPLPQAAIAGAITVCLNAPAPPITFTGSGGMAPYTFNYTINGVAQTPVVSNAAGIYTLNAPTNVAGTFVYSITTVTDASITLCNQSYNNTVTTTVTVKPLPTASVTGSATTVCLNAASPQITFTGSTGTAPYTFSYTLNGVPQTPVVSNAAGTYTINVPTTAVGPQIYVITNVQESSANTCSQAITGQSYTVTVNPLPQATIAGATAVCLNAASPQVIFTGSGGTAPYTFAYTINGVAQTPVVSNAGGTYTINAPTNVAGTFVYSITTVTDASSTLCNQSYNNTVTTTITIRPLPTPDFITTAPLCETRDISFTDNSNPQVGSVTNWSWNFGDPGSGTLNNNSILQNPVHNFSTAGNYLITLNVTTNNGCSNAVPFTRTITINDRPKAGFIVPEVCINDVAAVFIDTSKIANGAISGAGYEWNYGDPPSGVNNTSFLKDGSHLYTLVGPYNVTHVVTSTLGCKDTVMNPIFINGANPVANFSVSNPTTLCSNDSVAITNLSTIGQGSITKVEIYWDWIGAPATVQVDDFPAPNKVYRHKYPTFQAPLTQPYTIRFVAYSGTLCLDTKNTSIAVNAAPKVQFNAMPDVCYDAAPFLITQGSEVGGVPGTFAYNGPGIVNPNGLFNPAAAGVGTHTIKYTFTSSAAGCVDSASKTITVLDTASSKFSFLTPICEGSSTTFKEESTAPAGVTLSNTIWNFGDGSPLENHAPGTSFTHTYASWGSYNVTMYNTSAYGCKSKPVTKAVYVSPIPNAVFAFGQSSVCIPNADVSFINNSTIADGTENAFTYMWDMGDPSSGISNASVAKTPPPHHYTGTGPYTVSLTVTSGTGCAKTTTKNVDFIHPQPKTAFNFSKPSVCIGDNVVMTDITNGLDGTINQWFWKFSDGGTDNKQQVIYTFGAPKTYDVSLYTINSNGCNSDTLTKQFTVYAYPTVDAGPDRVVLEGGAITIEPIVTGNGLQYLWTPATYLNSTTIEKPTANNILDDITYTLTVTGEGGCTALPDKMFVKVLKMPKVPNTFTPNGDGINDTWIIQYLETYPNCKVQVFTRTGQLVFESRGYKTPWDGRYNGKALPFDTYYYIIEPENGRKPVTGYVTIVK